jgi:hypothetical protein
LVTVTRDSVGHVHEPTPSVSSLGEALAAADAADTALIAFGVPSCPSCELLDATLGAIQRVRRGLWVGIAALTTREDWAARELLLWPRGIHVSRVCVPVLAVLRGGEVLATRQGGGPAAVIDPWLTEVLGPPDVPLTAGISGDEATRLDTVADLRVRHLRTYAAHAID